MSTLNCICIGNDHIYPGDIGPDGTCVFRACKACNPLIKEIKKKSTSFVLGYLFYYYPLIIFTAILLLFYYHKLLFYEE